MAKWGRAGLISDAPVEQRSMRHGLWSLALAAIAFACTIGALIFATSVPDEAPISDVAFGGFLVIFLLFAPAAHIAGIVLGIVGLVKGGSNASSIVGIILNMMLIGVGVVLAWAGLQGAAAFT